MWQPHIVETVTKKLGKKKILKQFHDLMFTLSFPLLQIFVSIMLPFIDKEIALKHADSNNIVTPWQYLGWIVPSASADWIYAPKNIN